jgi:phage host-nuclease inhibitor protein Gam
MDARAKAEALLRDVASAAENLRLNTQDANEALEKVRAQFAPAVQAAKADLEAFERELERHCQKHQGEIFGDRDRVDLGPGALLHGVTRVVRKAKVVTVELLKRLGWTDGIQVTESVNWDKVAGWTDERLAAIGTERKRKETWGYELKEKRHG